MNSNSFVVSPFASVPLKSPAFAYKIYYILEVKNQTKYLLFLLKFSY
jgi:hypothetical protein